MQPRSRLALLLVAAAAAVIPFALDAQDSATANATSGPSTSQINGEFEQAKQLTSQRRFSEAIARAESAIAKLRILAQQAQNPTRDLAILTIFGDGDAGVSVVVKNMGNTASGAPMMLYQLPAGGGNPVPLTTISLPMSLPTPLGPGETRTVKSRPFGCNTTQRVKAKVDHTNSIAETDETNNESQAIEVRARRSCGS